MRPARQRVVPVIERLKRHYPDAKCSLDYGDPLQLLVATILSAQCTDERVNIVTRTLFPAYPTAQDYADADPEALAAMIKSTGFYRNKTQSLIRMGEALVDRHDGDVPRTLQELVALPGVGRKTANVVLGNAFGIDEGVVVDTHVKRITSRLGFTTESHPDKIEQDLMDLVPRDEWTLFPHLMIHHGREICQARRPRCEICPVNEFCPFPDGSRGGTDGDPQRRKTKTTKGRKRR